MQALRNGVYTLVLEFFCISLLQICCKLNILSARKDYQWLLIVFLMLGYHFKYIFFNFWFLS